MATFAAAVRALSAKLEQLKSRPSCRGDWVRLDAATTSAALVARHELSGVAVEDIDREGLDELLDELRYIKLCAQSRMYEL